MNKDTRIPDFKNQSKKQLFKGLQIAKAKALKSPINGKIAKKNLIEYKETFL